MAETVALDLADRLKAVREKLKYSQREMSVSVGASLTSWQGYEAGKNIPGGNVLAALARMGFNVNWVLTGEGVMWRDSSGGWWTAKMKEIRGSLTIPEFVRKVGFADEDEAIRTIQAIEDEKMEADFSLMNVLLNELGISVDWMFGVHDVPKMIAERTSGAFCSINIDLLKDIIKEVELHESINPGSLSLDKKAKLMAELYTMRAAKGR